MTSRSSHGESRRETIRVLHVDDEPDLTDLTATLLQREDDRIVVDTATSASDGLSRLAEDTFDCVVSDYEMPGKNGIEFLEAVREEYPGLPFMLFTGRGSEEVASEAISAGVTDYLQKGRDTSQYTVLANRVSNAVEQYRAKREAAATRQRLSIFFEQSPLGAIEWTDDFECLRLNETATEILGYSEDDLVGESWKSVVAEPFHEQFSDVVADPLTADAGLHDTTTEVVTQDGERIVCEWHHRVVTNDDGELITIFSKFQDITDEYRRQQRRERQQNTLIDLATEDAVATGDFETAVQRITETAADVLDVPRVNVWLIEEDDQEGTLSCVDHYERPADTHDRHMELDLDDYPAYFEALKTHRAIGVSDAQEDPRTAELADYLETQDIGALLDATLWSGGDVVGVVCHEHVDGTREWTDDELDFASDIADIIYRALQNRERRRQRQELELKDRAMDAAPAGITITDPARDDNPLIYVNERFERLTGYSAGEILGQNCRFLQGKNTDPGPVARLREAIDAAEPVSVELRNYREDGTEFWNRVSIAPVRTNGEVTNYVGFQQDITEEKERAAELQRKERRYQAVFNDPNILVGLLDTDGTVLDINETAMNYVDATPDEIVDRPFPETPWFDHSEAVQEEVEEWIDRAASGEYVDFEVELIHSSGTPYTVEGVFRPVTDEDGNVVSLLISDRDITEQKEHERALEQTNTLLSTLFETLPVGILAEDEHRNVLAANKRLFELFEVSELPDDIVGEDCEQMARDMSEMFVDPDDFVTGVEKRISDHSPADGDELVLRDGRTFERSYRPLDLPDGGGHVWVYRDITDRERHEQTVTALHETAEEIHRADTDQQVVEVMVDAVAGLLDMPLNGVALHDGAENVLRLAALTEEVEELFGDLPTFRPGDSLAWEAFETGETVQYDDVSAVPGRLNPDTVIRSEIIVPVGDHGVTIVGSTESGTFDMTDVSLVETLASHAETALDRIERERELAIKTQRLDAVLDNTTTPMFMKDDDGHYIFVNRGYRELFELQNEPIAGQTDYDLHPSEMAAKFQEDDKTVIERGEPLETEEKIIADGEHRWVLVTKAPIYDTGERSDPETPVAVFGVASDITELRRRERHLQRERDRLDEFASIISHDLRNPLNVAVGRLELLEEDCESPHLEPAERALSRMNTLIEDLLTLAREGDEVGDTEPVDLAHLTETCWRNVDTADATVVTDLERTVYADRSRLQQLFENLFRNAVEHGSTSPQSSSTPEDVEHAGGDVTVTVGELNDGFYVEDDGQGIPANERETVFDAGYSTAEDGTGFGLSIVNQVAKAHGWDVTVTGGSEGGARFEITGVEFTGE